MTNAQYLTQATWETLFHWVYWIVLVAILLGGIYWFSKRRTKRTRNGK